MPNAHLASHLNTRTNNDKASRCWKVKDGDLDISSMPKASVSEEETQTTVDDKLEYETEDSKPASLPNASRKRRSYIDASLLTESEAEQLEARRAYNRTCAAKARKRCKDLTAQLQEQVAKLKDENLNLEHQIEVARAKMQFLERQNMLLVTSQQSQPLLSPISLLGSQQHGITNNSIGVIRGIDQSLYSIPSLPYMQPVLGLTGTSNIHPLQRPSTALGTESLDLTRENSNARLSLTSNIRGLDQQPPL